jgi:penicillin-binding protein 1A
MFRRVRNRYLRYLLIFVYFIIIFFSAIELNFLWLFGYSPDMQDIKNPSLSLSSEVYYSDGTLIGRYYKENRSPVEFINTTASIFIHSLPAYFQPLRAIGVAAVLLHNNWLRICLKQGKKNRREF